MSQIQAFLYQSGRIEPFPLDATSFDEALLKVSKGTYTVFRIYPGNKVLRFHHHIDRLKRSAEILKMPFLLQPSTNREAVKFAVEASCIFLPRICFLIPFSAPNTIVLMAQAFSLPAQEEIQKGVHVALVPIQRENPSAKDSSFIHVRSKLHRQHPNVREILLYDEKGHVLEGLSSNFFAVMNNELRTTLEGVLPGISGSILLEVAKAVLPIRFKPIQFAEISEISEAAITSTSRGVLSVVEVNKIRVGKGVPGPVMAKLRSLFDARVRDELEPLC